MLTGILQTLVQKQFLSQDSTILVRASPISDPSECTWSGRWMGAFTAHNIYCRYDNHGRCGYLECSVNHFNYRVRSVAATIILVMPIKIYCRNIRPSFSNCVQKKKITGYPTSRV
ncbi:Delta-aminolevulinic acid dehydratase [Dirofilaria immitis]